MALVTLLFIAFFIILGYLLYYITNKSTSRLVIASLITSLIFILLLGCLLYDSLSKLSKIDDYSKLSQFGDYIGGLVSPLISVFGVVAAGFAFYAQYAANNQIQKQFDEQKKIDYRQNFETTFFNLLNIHHDIVKNIDFDTIAFFPPFSEIKQYLGMNGTDIEFNINKMNPVSSRDVFKVSLDVLKNLIKEDLNLEHQSNIPLDKDFIVSAEYAELKKKLLDFEKIFSKKEINFLNHSKNTRFQSIYDSIYFKLSTDFGHYFRNVYRIFKMVDERKFSDDLKEDFKIKYFYTSIVRSQLSDDEIVWLFFNCLTDKGSKKFKPLLEKYSILKIINDDDPTYNFYTKFYHESAFNKPKGENLEEHIKKFSKN